MYGSKIGYRLVPRLAGVPAPDVIIKIECDGKTAYQRIMERLKTPGYRKKMPHLHETEKQLEELNKTYNKAIREYISSLGKRAPSLITIDGTKEIQEVYKDLRAHLKAHIEIKAISSPAVDTEEKHAKDTRDADGRQKERRQKENLPWTHSPTT